MEERFNFNGSQAISLHNLFHAIWNVEQNIRLLPASILVSITGVIMVLCSLPESTGQDGSITCASTFTDVPAIAAIIKIENR